MKKTGGILLIVALIGLLIYLLYPNALDVITNASARQVYQRDFASGFKTEQKDNARLKLEKWSALYKKSQKDSLEITLPFTSVGQWNVSRNEVYSFNFKAQRGHIIHAEILKTIDSAQVFIDILQLNDNNTKNLLSNKPYQKAVSQKVTQDGDYKVIIQPEITLDTSFQINIYTTPQYTFPVTGAGNKNIQSFWGADRDGGKRAHKGNDIFAARGTAVVAITDGIISSTGNRGLGGKQVWLRDGIFGQSLYYAHLDSIIATQGQRVKTGDTLGLVGNTGNARTTPPHLHFGIYTNGGAIDPLPFIKISEVPKEEKSFTIIQGAITSKKVNLYQKNNRKAAVLHTFERNDTISVFGKNDTYFLVSAGDSIRGFLKAQDLRLLK